MNRRLHTTSGMHRAGAALVLAAFALSAPACAGNYQRAGAGDSATAPPLAGGPSAAPLATSVQGRTAGPVTFEAYEGRRSGDARLPALLDRMTRVVGPTVDAMRSRAGLDFFDGRGPVVRLTPGSERSVTLRLVDGVRRPLVSVPIDDLLSGKLQPQGDFAPMLVEAALVAAGGDRSPPAWLRAGVPLEITDTVELALHRRALAGDDIVTSDAELIPQFSAGGVDPLWAAVRLRALERIARGDDALSRFLAARLEGAGAANALSEVGVQGDLFLDAATDTDRARALERLSLGGPFEALAQARRAVARGETEKAGAPLGVLQRALEKGGLSAFVAADTRVVLGEAALAAGQPAAARQHLAAALAHGEQLLRPREARILEARLEMEAGEKRQAAALYRTLLEDFPGAVDAEEALAAMRQPDPPPPVLVERVPDGPAVPAPPTSARRPVAGPDRPAPAAPSSARPPPPRVPPMRTTSTPPIAPQPPAAATSARAPVDSVDSPDPKARVRAAARLARSADPAAAKTLRRLASDRDAEVRRVSLAALVMNLGTGAVPDLEAGTGDLDPAVRRQALGLLQHADPQSARLRAARLRADDDPGVRGLAQEILAGAGAAAVDDPAPTGRPAAGASPRRPVGPLARPDSAAAPAPRPPAPARTPDPKPAPAPPAPVTGSGAGGGAGSTARPPPPRPAPPPPPRPKTGETDPARRLPPPPKRKTPPPVPKPDASGAGE